MIMDFKLSKKDRAALDKVIARAKKELVITDVQDMDMSLTACHKYDVKLDFEKMLRAKVSDLGHDIYGIIRHINPETGKLGRHFHPRCHA